MSTIPELDISRLESDTHRFVRELGDAYSEWGFAGIVGHGISPQVITSAMRAAERFFALSDPEKRRYDLPGGRARGFTPFGVEKAKDARHTDLKEFYHIGRSATGLPDNVWPEQPADFRPAFDALYTSLDKLAHRVLSAMALSLALPADYFDNKVNVGDSILRVLHYPPIEDQSVPNLRAAAHEDINLITLLVGSEQAGLEVLSRSGEWVPITMIDGAIICNVGDMMQRLTNRRLKSTTHRVANPDGDSVRSSRFSMPFFMHPNADMSLDALPQCVDAQHPKEFAPITAGEYLDERLREIGLKP